MPSLAASIAFWVNVVVTSRPPPLISCSLKPRRMSSDLTIWSTWPVWPSYASSVSISGKSGSRR